MLFVESNASQGSLRARLHRAWTFLRTHLGPEIRTVLVTAAAKILAALRTKLAQVRSSGR